MVKRRDIVEPPAAESKHDFNSPCIDVTRNYQKTIHKYVYIGYGIQTVIIGIGVIDLYMDISIRGFIILISTITLGLVGREIDMKSKEYVEEVEKSC